MRQSLRVLHLVSGDLWAGAEVQAFTLLSHLNRMPQTEVAAILMNEGTLAAKLRSAGISVYVIDERRAGPFQILCALRGVLRDWRPDVVHTHREKENILGSLGNRACRNVSCVRTVHGAKESAATGWRRVRHGVIYYVDRWCGRVLQHRVIAVTNDLAEKLGGKFSIGKIVVIENGIDFDAIRSQRGIAEFKAREPDAIHVGIAGRLVEIKRIDLFLETAALLLRDCPEQKWRFHIFGDGPMRAKLEALSDRLGLTDTVIFHGHRDDIEICLGGLSTLVICSDHEGLPMISLEAAALGVPAVAHAVGGLIDVIAEELLVHRHDAAGYKEGVLRALRADSRAIILRRAEQTAARFSAQTNAENVRALYEEVVAKRKYNR